MPPSLPSLKCGLAVAWAYFNCLAACQQSGAAQEAGSNCRSCRCGVAIFKVLVCIYASMVWGVSLRGILHLDTLGALSDVQLETTYINTAAMLVS